VNSCLEDLEGIIGLNRLGKFVPIEPGFWEFNKKRVTGRWCVLCKNLGGTEPREGRGCKTKKEVVEYRKTTEIESNRSRHSGSSCEIPMILRTLFSMASRRARCEAGAPAQRGEQCSIKLRMNALKVI